MIGKVIKYEIDNHSNIINVDLLHECFSYSSQHWRYRKEKYIIKAGLPGCYLLYNDKKEIVYIGKSNNCIRQRLISHLIKQPYDFTSYCEKERNLIKKQIVKYFSFIVIEKQMIDFVERGLINEYQPILNIDFINK